MNAAVRRIVTTHDANGTSVLHADDRIAFRSLRQAGANGAFIWSTGEVPADNARDIAGEKRSQRLHRGEGSTLWVTEFEAGCCYDFHRTHTIDYFIVLAGSVELELDGGSVTTLVAGDIGVQRGTNHRWRNQSANEPCRICFCMIEAIPIEIEGRLLDHSL